MLKKNFDVVDSNNVTIEQLNNLSPDLFVVAAYGKILSPELLKIPTHGALNIHPSLLPKYRGPTPVQTVILNGDTETGVTIIVLDNELDHGPILVQQTESILPTDTAQSLHERLFKIGAKLLDKNIDQYLNDSIKLKQQEHKKAIYTKHLTRTDGYINISDSRLKKDILDRMTRAYHPWPGVWTKWKVESGKLKIIKFLPGEKIQVEGKKPMSYKDFINGYPDAKSVILPMIK